MNKTSLTALLSITILTSVIAISEIPTAFATFGINPDNGHYYEFITDNNIKWTDAKAAAESRTYNGVSGHLVTITSENEKAFVGGLVPDSSRAWIGLSDENTEGQYKWVTGEPYSYENWASGQPDNTFYETFTHWLKSTSEDEDYVEMYGWSDKWNDNKNLNTYQSITGYVVEYDDIIVQNPNNRHYYEYIDYPGITWTEAKAAAESSTHNGISGHLVTTTTANETLFLLDLVPNNTRVWIGLSDENKEGQYKWVTGEPFIFSKWDVNQPDNAGNNEDYVEFLESSERWNDLPNDYNSIDGYIIEYTIPPVINPANGHYYKYIHDPYNTWTNAKTAAENSTYNGLNGHLATITSASENTFVADLVSDDVRTWIGLTDKDTEGTYQWVTGEPFIYTNWDVNQPDNYNGNEDYVQFRGYSGKWNDMKNNADYSNGYIIEYDIPHLNPDNGHYYEFVTDYNISWTDAKAAAENSTFNGNSGHLVTIANNSENSFVSDLVPDNLSAWIGLTDVITEEQYKWVTGEPFDYSNWNTGQPSAGIGEHFVDLRSDGKWNDTKLYSSTSVGYIIEYSD